MQAKQVETLPSALRSIGRGLLGVPRSVAWLLPLGWAALITWLSSQRVVLGGPELFFMPLLSNLVHAFEYGVLAILCVPCLARHDGWVRVDGARFAWIGGLCWLFAWTDEWHQSYVPFRSASLLDLLTDLVGIVACLYIVRLLAAAKLTQRQLLRVLGAAALASLAAAGASTAWDTYVGEGPWPFSG